MALASRPRPQAARGGLLARTRRRAPLRVVARAAGAAAFLFCDLKANCNFPQRFRCFLEHKPNIPFFMVLDRIRSERNGREAEVVCRIMVGG